jgi:SHS2 domain-containing protein
MTYQLLEHTADVRVLIRARDRRELYQSAVDLVRELEIAAGQVRSSLRRVMPGPGDDEAEDFFRFVRELLFLFDVEGFIPMRVDLARSRQAPVVLGDTFDPQRHEGNLYLKAVTRHHYRFEHGRGGFEVELVFDV